MNEIRIKALILRHGKCLDGSIVTKKTIHEICKNYKGELVPVTYNFDTTKILGSVESIQEVPSGITAICRLDKKSFKEMNVGTLNNKYAIAYLTDSSRPAQILCVGCCGKAAFKGAWVRKLRPRRQNNQLAIKAIDNVLEDIKWTR